MLMVSIIGSLPSTGLEIFPELAVPPRWFCELADDTEKKIVDTKAICSVYCGEFAASDM